MGKQRQAKKQRRELAALPPPKKLLIGFEEEPALKRVLKQIDEIHLRRSDFVAFQQQNGSEECWHASVYFPSTFVTGLINPQVRGIIQTADLASDDGLQQFSDACNTTDKLAQEITTLAAWRPGQGIYHFDPDMLGELLKTEISDEIPVNVFRRLPEWCVYIDFPLHAGTLEHPEKLMEGFFAYCDEQPVPDNPTVDGVLESLMLVPVIGRPDPSSGDTKYVMLPFLVPLLDGKGAAECVDIGLHRYSGADTGKFRDFMASLVGAMLPMVLYVCSDDMDVQGKIGKPVRAKPRIKIADRLGHADGIQHWQVGMRFGAALRKHCEQEQDQSITQDPGVPTGQRKRPHLRRAHFHGYWYGPRDAVVREYRYKWLSPALINVRSSDDIVPTVHEVSAS